MTCRRPGTGVTAASAPATTAGPASTAPATADGLTSAAAPAAAKSAGGGSAGTGATEVSVVPGIARYHLADCILIRFLGDDDLESMSLPAAEAAGYVPCKACKPEQAQSK